MPHNLTFKSQPIAYITIAVAIAMVVVDVAVNGTPLSEVFTEHYLQGILLAAGGVVAWFSVYAPANVEDDAEYDDDDEDLFDDEDGDEDGDEGFFGDDEDEEVDPVEEHTELIPEDDVVDHEDPIGEEDVDPQFPLLRDTGNGRTVDEEEELLDADPELEYDPETGLFLRPDLVGDATTVEDEE